MHKILSSIGLLIGAALLWNGPADAEKGRSGQTLFPSAELALAEFKAAVKAENSERLVEIFGKESASIFITGDPVDDAVGLRRLSQKLDERAELLPVNSDEFQSEQWYLIRYGIEGWDMHIPLVNRGQGWCFAIENGTAADLRVRRSLNEVATIDTLRALVRAQGEYKSQDRNKDGMGEYAQKFLSSPGKQDGLYWPTKDGSPQSPLDGLVARALKDGYKPGGKSSPTYGGYIYKMLNAQGGKTRGGKKSYLKDGRLLEGFAILAYPVTWNSSGDFTFLVGVDGQVWKKDLGSRTESIASDITSMNLDQTWIRVDPSLGGDNSRVNW